MVGLCATVYAQRSERGDRDRGERRGGHMKVLLSQLDLSDDQKEAIKDLHKKNKPSEKGDKKARRNSEEMRAALDEILTDEQSKKLDTLIAEKKAKREAHKAEIQAYREKNVIPVLTAERKKFDASLSTAEKEIIAKARAARPDKEDRENGEHPDRELMKDIRAEIKTILENHEDELDAIWVATAADREQWKQDLREIHKSHMPEKADKSKKQAKKMKKNEQSDTEGKQVEKRTGSKRDRSDRGPKGRKGRHGESIDRVQFLLLEY